MVLVKRHRLPVAPERAVDAGPNRESFDRARPERADSIDRIRSAEDRRQVLVTFRDGRAELPGWSAVGPASRANPCRGSGIRHGRRDLISWSGDQTERGQAASEEVATRDVHRVTSEPTWNSIGWVPASPIR